MEWYVRKGSKLKNSKEKIPLLDVLTIVCGKDVSTYCQKTSITPVVRTAHTVLPRYIVWKVIFLH